MPTNEFIGCADTVVDSILAASSGFHRKIRMGNVLKGTTVLFIFPSSPHERKNQPERSDRLD